MQTVEIPGYKRAIAPTAHDTTLEAEVADGILILAVGNLVFLSENGVAHTVTGALVGTVIPVRTSRINSTGLTATVALLYAQRS
jgi:hypothetical protein